MFMNGGMNHAELIEWTLHNRPLDYPPGEKYAYSNFGYCVLGRVIEKIANQPYATFVSNAVLKRCGINDMAIGGNTLAERRPQEAKYYGQGDNPYGMNIARMDSHGGWIARPASRCGSWGTDLCDPAGTAISARSSRPDGRTSLGVESCLLCRSRHSDPASSPSNGRAGIAKDAQGLRKLTRPIFDASNDL
jgi:CubicO group peptidase (beta-lactamase class C family)